jgi:carbonic anhydrase
MSPPTLLDAVLAANAARVGGDRDARAALPAGAIPFVITCMDPRLIGNVLPALGLEGMPVPQAKFAGGLVRPGEPAAARSVLAAAIFNMATEVLVVGHTDCRMGKTSAMEIRDGVRRLGVPVSAMDGQDPALWLGAFASERGAVEQSVAALRADPRIPPKMPVHGLLFRLEDRRVELIVSGYAPRPAAQAAYTAPGGYVPGPVSLGAPPPPVFGAPGPPPPPSLAPSGLSAPPPPPFGSAPSLVPTGLAPPSFPSAPSMDTHPPADAPPPPAEPPPAPDFRPKPKKRRPRGDGGSPFDRAKEVLDRLRREE